MNFFLRVLIACVAVLFQIKTLNAQITINKSDFLLVVDSITIANDTTSFMNPGSSGANQTWNFAAYNPSKSGFARYNLNSFPPNPLFPAANFASQISVPNFISGYNYGVIDSSGAYFLGSDMNFVTPASSNLQLYNPRFLDIPFPLTYNRFDSSQTLIRELKVYNPAFNFSGQLCDSVRINYHRDKSILCDGWGSITTPYGTYNTLRIKIIETNYDSTWIHPQGGVWTFKSKSNVNPEKLPLYKWLANGKMEVASIRTNRGSNGIYYAYSFLKQLYLPSSGLKASNETSNEFNVYPNPTNYDLNISYNLNTTSVVNLNIYNILGEKVLSKIENETQNPGMKAYSISSLAPGIYMVKILIDNKEIVRKVFIQ